MEINHELAERVLDKIRSYPNNFSMYDWCSRALDDGQDPVECGTTLCVGGWIDQLTTGRVNQHGIEGRAAKALGIPYTGLPYDPPLFFTDEDRAIRALEILSKPDGTWKKAAVECGWAEW